MPDEEEQLKQAIDANDLDRLRTLMTANPELHRAPLGYGKNGPLTWVAECRVPGLISTAPGSARLAMAQWMIEHGSDVHQGGDGPLMRAALNGCRVPMMELLVACEAVDPVELAWLLDHGANPNCAKPERRYRGTALDYLIGAYARSARLSSCIDILLKAGGVTKYNEKPLLDLLCGRIDLLTQHLDADPALVTRRFPELDFGTTGGRMLTLQGSTLLHVAAEYGNPEAAKLLLDRGADVNAAGEFGQTAIFHAVTQFRGWSLPVARLLVERGADLSVRAKVPGHYERPGEMVECTPLGYAEQFPGEMGENGAIELLRDNGAM